MEDFPDRVLDAEQQAYRANRILEVLAGRIDGIGWRCLTAEGQGVFTRVWNRAQCDLMALDGMAL